MAVNEGCAFCEVVQRTAATRVVYGEDLTLAVTDFRWFDRRCSLVIPRQHAPDVRRLDAVAAEERGAVFVKGRPVATVPEADLVAALVGAVREYAETN